MAKAQALMLSLQDLCGAEACVDLKQLCLEGGNSVREKLSFISSVPRAVPAGEQVCCSLARAAPSVLRF